MRQVKEELRRWLLTDLKLEGHGEERISQNREEIIPAGAGVAESLIPIGTANSHIKKYMPSTPHTMRDDNVTH